MTPRAAARMSAAMSEQDIICERRGAAGCVLLNRPRALNALTHEMVEGLAAALEVWERDPAVERVVISGAGDRAFCAGGDVKSMLTRNYNEPGSHTLDEYIHRQRLEQRAISGRLFTMPKPTLAAIPGAAAGAGASG